MEDISIKLPKLGVIPIRLNIVNNIIELTIGEDEDRGYIEHINLGKSLHDIQYIGFWISSELLRKFNDRILVLKGNSMIIKYVIDAIKQHLFFHEGVLEVRYLKDVAYVKNIKTSKIFEKLLIDNGIEVEEDTWTSGIKITI